MRYRPATKVPGTNRPSSGVLVCEAGADGWMTTVAVCDLTGASIAIFYKFVRTKRIPAAPGEAYTEGAMKLAILALGCSITAAAGDFKVLQDFGIGNFSGGNDLYAGLVMDAAGNLYGAAESGGKYGAGVIFELSKSGESWTETVLYDFKGLRSQDGAQPHATPVFDSAGNLYGTTVAGGLSSPSCHEGCGTVFKLTPAAGEWQESVLYRFDGSDSGAVPYAGVALDAAGNLYGATIAGGASGMGLVYRLEPGPSAWVQTVLHSFSGTDGAGPYATPLLDTVGNIYGTTEAGGGRNMGVIYALHQSGSAWNLRVLHTFRGGTDGANPLSGVIFGPGHSLYGTTSIGGSANCGIAYQLVRNSTGAWSETILHTFQGILQNDGENPNGLLADGHGNLYGTTTGGGTDNPGTIFKMSPLGGGAWQETVLYSFTAGLDGAYPMAGVVMDASGNLYGTTLWGGPSGDTTGGVAFEYIP